MEVQKSINSLEKIPDNKDLVKNKSKSKINKKKNKEIKIEKPIITFSIKQILLYKNGISKN